MNSPKKILIVDDDPKIVKALSLRLSAAGYKTTTTYNGITGLICAKTSPPDLVITDIWMPSGTGLSLAYRLRELMPGIPVIFLTASKQPGLEEKTRELGGAGFLEKPYEPEALLRIVAQLIQKPEEEIQQEEPALAVAH
jgi:DNA-binding response OmpR family regulator